MAITKTVMVTSTATATVSPIRVPHTAPNSGVPSVLAMTMTISSALISAVSITRK